MHQTKINNLLFFQSDLLKGYPEVIHRVSTRLGGVSSGPFTSLNLSFTTGDNMLKVRENRRRLCAALQVPLDSLTVAKQVHRANVKVVAKSDRGKDSLSYATALDNTDALVTDLPGITLLALSADCPLIICYEPEKKVIGLIHSSWRSAVEGVAERAIKRMRQVYHCRPDNIRAVISPAIGSCCYPVKEDFISLVTTLAPYSRNHVLRWRRKICFDLVGFVRAQLHRAGVWHRHIEIANLCTKHNPEWFYSYRRDGATTGRFGAVVGLMK